MRLGDVLATVFSVTGCPIRLTAERWWHIVENHNELAGYFTEVLDVLQQPEAVLEGVKGEHLAVKMLETNKWLVVVYREINSEDGFIITAHFTKRQRQLFRRRQIWP